MIDPALDPTAMTSAFKTFGRLHIPGFLAPAAARALHNLLASETLWMCSTTAEGTVVDVPVELLAVLPPAEHNRFLLQAHAEARRGFHYMFDSVRISTDIEKGRLVSPGYRALYDFLNGPGFLGFIRALTGDARPNHVDAQATRYQPGHYLTEHDDSNVSRGRLYAYVLNLTPEWRTDWGGLLTFIDEDGHISEAYRPAFNALNIFRVPQPHAVTYVAPFAAGSRLSVTGWIRDDGPVTIG